MKQPYNVLQVIYYFNLSDVYLNIHTCKKSLRNTFQISTPYALYFIYIITQLRK